MSEGVIVFCKESLRLAELTFLCSDSSGFTGLTSLIMGGGVAISSRRFTPSLICTEIFDGFEALTSAALVSSFSVSR